CRISDGGFGPRGSAGGAESVDVRLGKSDISPTISLTGTAEPGSIAPAFGADCAPASICGGFLRFFMGGSALGIHPFVTMVAYQLVSVCWPAVPAFARFWPEARSVVRALRARSRAARRDAGSLPPRRARRDAPRSQARRRARARTGILPRTGR